MLFFIHVNANSIKDTKLGKYLVGHHRNRSEPLAGHSIGPVPVYRFWYFYEGRFEEVLIKAIILHNFELDLQTSGLINIG